MSALPVSASLGGVAIGADAGGRAGTSASTLGDAFDAGLTPIDLLLGRQHELTPVERFSRWHEADRAPAGERWWRDRLPTEGPGPGQQYGFEVDLDSCTGCKACVSACNSLNGLDDDEAWRTVTTVHGRTPEGPAVLTVTAACHHCLDPACLSGCPVDAYEKDPVTGIVAHLDDQCIGCSYCTLMCPYEVPTYRPDLGIVRKCDLCRGRLAEGEAPACVQGCPNGAITVAVVDVEEVRAELAEAVARAAETGTRPRLVAGTPDSTLTVPTTRYRSNRAGVTDGFTDHRLVHPGHGHTPLAVMLVLTQLAVGASVVDAAVASSGRDVVPNAVPGLALGVALVALGASLGHLGRPLHAWRAVIGFRHSWLSREIMAFSAFAGLGLAYAVASTVHLGGALVTGLRVATAVAGLVGVGCSVALYAVTGRRWWRVRTSAARFGVTALSTGALAVAAVTLAWPDGTRVVPVVRSLLAGAAALVVLGLVAQAVLLRPGRSRPRPDLDATRSLLLGPLWNLTLVRVGAASVGGVVVPLAVAGSLPASGPPGGGAAAVTAVAALVLLAGELAERRLFFLASVPPRLAAPAPATAPAGPAGPAGPAAVVVEEGTVAADRVLEAAGRS